MAGFFEEVRKVGATPEEIAKRKNAVQPAVPSIASNPDLKQYGLQNGGNLQTLTARFQNDEQVNVRGGLRPYPNIGTAPAQVAQPAQAVAPVSNTASPTIPAINQVRKAAPSPIGKSGRYAPVDNEGFPALPPQDVGPVRPIGANVFPSAGGPTSKYGPDVYAQANQYATSPGLDKAQALAGNGYEHVSTAVPLAHDAPRQFHFVKRDADGNQIDGITINEQNGQIWKHGATPQQTGGTQVQNNLTVAPIAQAANLPPTSSIATLPAKVAPEMKTDPLTGKMVEKTNYAAQMYANDSPADIVLNTEYSLTGKRGAQDLSGADYRYTGAPLDSIYDSVPLPNGMTHAQFKRLPQNIKDEYVGRQLGISAGELGKTNAETSKLGAETTIQIPSIANVNNANARKSIAEADIGIPATAAYHSTEANKNRVETKGIQDIQSQGLHVKKAKADIYKETATGNSQNADAFLKRTTGTLAKEGEGPKGKNDKLLQESQQVYKDEKKIYLETFKDKQDVTPEQLMHDADLYASELARKYMATGIDRKKKNDKNAVK